MPCRMRACTQSCPGRLFRKFRSGLPIENVLFYTGNAHANKYRSILEHFHFHKIHEIKESNARPFRPNQCINIEEFKHPFFS